MSTQSPAEGGAYRRNDDYRARKAQITDALHRRRRQVLRRRPRRRQPARPHRARRDGHAAVPGALHPLHRAARATATSTRPSSPGSNRPQHRTEIDGLWLVGANTASGHGVAGTMVGGVNCAGEILDRPLLVEMMMGTAAGRPHRHPRGSARLRPDGVEPRRTAPRGAGRRPGGTSRSGGLTGDRINVDGDAVEVVPEVEHPGDQAHDVRAALR